MRLTNAFSKKIENHAAAVAIWFMYYNFCGVHQTLRVMDRPKTKAGYLCPKTLPETSFHIVRPSEE